MKIDYKAKLLNARTTVYKILLNTSTKMYEHSFKYILILWTIFSIMEFIRINYTSCIRYYSEEFHISELTFIAIFGVLIVQIFIHIYIFKDNDKIMIDEKNTESAPLLGGGTIKYLVIPIYAIVIYSISKVIIYIYTFTGKESDVFSVTTYVHFSMWFMFLIGSLIMWYKVQKKAEKKWDFAITFSVVLVTSVQLYWNSFFLPLTYGVMDISECVGIEITKEYAIKNPALLEKELNSKQ